MKCAPGYLFGFNTILVVICKQKINIVLFHYSFINIVLFLLTIIINTFTFIIIIFNFLILKYWILTYNWYQICQSYYQLWLIIIPYYCYYYYYQAENEGGKFYKSGHITTHFKPTFEDQPMDKVTIYGKYRVLIKYCVFP